MIATDFGKEGRATAVAAWCRAQGLPPPSKV